MTVPQHEMMPRKNQEEEEEKKKAEEEEEEKEKKEDVENQKNEDEDEEEDRMIKIEIEEGRKQDSEDRRGAEEDADEAEEGRDLILLHPPQKKGLYKIGGDEEDAGDMDAAGGGGGGGGGGGPEEDGMGGGYPSPPDGGWGWAVVFASFMIHVLADGFTYTFGIYFVQLMQYYKATAAATSWIASILVGVTLGTGPIAGVLVNKFGCRAVTIAGAILASFALFCSIWAPSVKTLYITIGLGAGLGFGLIYLPAIVCVTCYFEKRRSFATGIAVCGSGIGTFAFSPLVEYLINTLSWQNSLIIVSGLMLNCVVFGAMFRPLDSIPEPQETKPPTEPPQTPTNDLYDPHGDLNNCHMLLDPPSGPNSVFATPPTLAPPTPSDGLPSPVIINPDTLVAHPLQNNAAFPSLPPLPHAKRFALDRLRKNFSDINLRGGGTPGSTPGGTPGQRHSQHAPHRRHPLHLPPSHVQNSLPRVGSDGTLDPLDTHIKGAVSQPLLPSPQGGVGAGAVVVGSRLSHHGGSKGSSLPPSHHGSGLLYRKDIFYRGSLLNIPSYRQDPGSYRASIMRLPDEETPSEAENAKVCGCIPCSREAKDAMTSLMDWGLLTDEIFILFAVSNFCTSLGFNAPYVFIVDRARQMGIPDSESSFLLAVVGIANTISRIVLGYISDQPWVNRLYLYNVALTLCGLGTCASIWFETYGSQIFYAALFGSTSGAYVGLTSVVLVDLLGMERLTNAFGLLLLCQGLASLIGPPMCAFLFDQTLSYDYSFLLAGGMIAASGIMLFLIPCIWRAQARKLVRQQPLPEINNQGNSQGHGHGQRVHVH